VSLLSKKDADTLNKAAEILKKYSKEELEQAIKCVKEQIVQRLSQKPVWDGWIDETTQQEMIEMAKKSILALTAERTGTETDKVFMIELTSQRNERFIEGVKLNV
jgi:flagellar motor switch protein FliG